MAALKAVLEKTADDEDSKKYLKEVSADQLFPIAGFGANLTHSSRMLLSSAYQHIYAATWSCPCSEHLFVPIPISSTSC